MGTCHHFEPLLQLRLLPQLGWTPDTLRPVLSALNASAERIERLLRISEVRGFYTSVR
jgi:hypothetical protein